MPHLPKRLFWRVVYDWLAGRDPDAFTFMNYGFVPDDQMSAAQEPRDERLCRQLYAHALGGADLRGASLVEIGCGRAGGLEWIARTRDPARAVGVDLSPKAVRLAGQRTGDLPNLEIRRGDAASTDLPPGAFDVVLNVESSHCYPSREAFYREAHRLLAPGGTLRHADFFTPEGAREARAAIAAAGFVEVRERDITRNVLEALRRDADRKRALVERQPRIVRAPLRQFCALEGTTMYEGFRDGSYVYLSFAAGRPPASPPPRAPGGDAASAAPA